MRTHSKHCRRAMLYLLASSLALSGVEVSAAVDQPTSAAAQPAATGPVAVPEPSAEGLVLPDLSFTETPEIAKGYDKFYYFHRPNTTFLEAYNDIRECEALANGSNIYMGNVDPTVAALQYGYLPAMLGGVIAGALIDGIFGAKTRRKEKRIKIRNCMGFKEYDRYGLPKALYNKLNFKPKSSDPKSMADHSLRLRALLASGPAPTQKVLPK